MELYKSETIIEMKSKWMNFNSRLHKVEVTTNWETDSNDYIEHNIEKTRGQKRNEKLRSGIDF